MKIKIEYELRFKCNKCNNDWDENELRMNQGNLICPNCMNECFELIIDYEGENK